MNQSDNRPSSYRRQTLEVKARTILTEIPPIFDPTIIYFSDIGGRYLRLKLAAQLKPSHNQGDIGRID